MLLNFYKSHHIFVHFPFALVVLSLFVVWAKNISTEKRQKIFKVIAALLLINCFYLCASGIGLALTATVVKPSTYVHGALGIVFYLFSSCLFFYRDRLWIKKAVYLSSAITLASIVSGTLTAAGTSYFSPRLMVNEQGDYLDSVFSKNQLAARKVTAILEKKCLRCHNESVAAGNLNLNNPSDVAKFIFPGKVDTLLGRVSAGPLEHKRMPLYSGQLSPTELHAIRDWVTDDIAASERGIASKDENKNSRHWTFTSFKKPLLPDPQNKKLIRNEVDQFLLSKIEKEPNFKYETIKPELLVKRLSLVLTGLTPETEALAQFAKLPDEHNYLKLKNSYLASKAFAENFSVYWMDLVSFADDNGPDGLPKEISQGVEFRKFLISGLAGNPSYYDLIRKQIKPSHDVKTGKLNTSSLINHIPLQTMPQISLDSAQNVIYSFTLGIEMRCARCHDHPIEPIKNEQYYQTAMPFIHEFNLPKPFKYFDNRMAGSFEMPKNRFLDLYEGSTQLKGFNKIDDLGVWLTDTEQGVGFYTARVFVDHVWRFVFGKSLVNVAGNFGASSPLPQHIDLLNWLTYDFIEHGTSIKHLVNKLTESAAFRSNNKIFRPRLLNTENIRDNFLKAANFLNKRSVYLPRSRYEEERQTDFHKHFGYPKYMDSTFERPAQLEIGSEMYFLNDSNTHDIVERIKWRLKLPSEDFSDSLTENLFLYTLGRAPTKKETDYWRNQFLKPEDFNEDLKNMIKTLISSSEFLYIP